MKKLLAKMGAVAMASAVLFTGCGEMNPGAALVTITHDETTDYITLGYGNFVARYTQALYDTYYGTYLSDDMWSEDLYGSGNTMEVDTKEEVMDTMEEEYVCKLHAEDYDVYVNDEDTEAIESAAEQFMSDNDEKTIEEMGATNEYVTELLTYRTYASRVKEAIEAEAEDKIEISDDEINQSTFSYVKIETVTTDDDGNTTAMSDDEISAAYQSASLIAESEDFDTAVTDAGLTASTQSFTTAEDPAEDEEMDEAVITAAQALSEGEVSDVIEVEDDGYYVLRMDSTYDEEATAEKETEVHDEKIEEYYDSIIEEWEAEITWSISDKMWEKVTFSALFEATTTDDASTEDTETEETETEEASDEATEETAE